jgi:hypothetical protein
MSFCITQTPSPAYIVLRGQWPILEEASPISHEVKAHILKNGTGIGIEERIKFLSLGEFYIDVDLLVPHALQRPMLPSHASKLLEDFEMQGILRSNNAGVVIGLGKGWMNMKNNTGYNYRITKDFAHLSRLSHDEGGPIAEVIRGGHRSEAVRRYALSREGREDEAYWIYTVLIPGVF